MASIQPLGGAFGVAIAGMALSQGVEAETMHLLTQTLYAHRVLVIRKQRLSQDASLHFGRQWGSPISQGLAHRRRPGYPAVLAIGNTAFD